MAATDGFAPAKINLTLHVTGQRPDGYHLLDSLVAFADIGDTVSASVAPGLSLSVTGPMAEGVPTDDSNLVLRAARLLAPGRGELLRATGRVLKPGRRLVVVTAEVHAIDAGAETLIAVLQGTMVPVAG